MVVAIIPVTVCFDLVVIDGRVSEGNNRNEVVEGLTAGVSIGHIYTLINGDAVSCQDQVFSADQVKLFSEVDDQIGYLFWGWQKAALDVHINAIPTIGPNCVGD